MSRRLVLGALAAIVVGLALAAPAEATHKGERRFVQNALFIGNNWDGTVDVIIPHEPFRHITRINIIPDKTERELEIATNPVDEAFYLAIFAGVGENHHQYADDMYMSKGGRVLAISRPSYKDVVGFDITDCELHPDDQGGERPVERCRMIWRFEVEGNRSDHMAVSPDGTHLAVSASTGNVVHILNLKTGEEEGQFPSGDSPHENIYSSDGEVIYHASIGRVYTPTDQNTPARDSSKGDRRFQIVDADTNEIIWKTDMGEELAKRGFHGMSSAVRPMTHSPSERFLYFQVSFFHGFVEYDLKRRIVLRVVRLPNLVPEVPEEEYLLDSAHHGIAMNRRGTKLCVAGTMSDYAAIVKRRSLRRRLIFGGKKPYWSTINGRGNLCFVSWSGSDRISAIRFRGMKEIARIPVGFHPQRMRIGNVRRAWLRDHR